MTAAPPAAAEQAIAALEAAKNGLRWYRDRCPDDVNGSDDEADEQIDSALTALRALSAQPTERGVMTSEPVATPRARWSQDGEPDPHGDRYECERAALAMGHLTDDELANEVFLNGDKRPTAQELIAGKLLPIAYLTAAKDRIRWLSRKLAAAAYRPETTSEPVARLGEHNGGDYDMRHRASAPEHRDPITHCGSVCRAGKANGIICSDESCDIDEGVRAAPALPQEGQSERVAQTAWMIETTASPVIMYCTGDEADPGGFSPDPNRGIRFPTKTSAERYLTMQKGLSWKDPLTVLKLGLSCYRVAEHGWSTSPSAAPAEQQEPRADLDEIGLAIALEQQRALKIVDDVHNLRIGGRTEAMPTAFQAGHCLACEEIEHRLRTERWELGGVPSPLPAALTAPIAAPALPGTKQLRRMPSVDMVEAGRAAMSPEKFVSHCRTLLTWNAMWDAAPAVATPEMDYVAAAPALPQEGQSDYEQGLWLRDLFGLIGTWGEIRDGTPSKAQAWNALWKHAHNIGPHWRARAYLASARQPLSDEQLLKRWHSPSMPSPTFRALLLHYARAIEQAHGIAAQPPQQQQEKK